MKSIKINIMGEYSGESIYTGDNELNKDKDRTTGEERNTPTDIKLGQSGKQVESNHLGAGAEDRIVRIIYYEKMRTQRAVLKG
ncbi:hypothetical protein C922_05406 [Plasmodium inui San Antonio 1]|uniref:Uncharacterized protein n=1 Tax=Plasmodium inui San Antonio 1 TaxID=1237626 RepID=W7AFZ3_9APIC|nr:hypothetical protein C922_05406 [Plasmodium inui San Antonio 1]EUD64216.1 hypothetical protein C922_05406 [Plasmodium inui San Antonio 1]